MKKYLFLVATILLTVSMSVSAQNNQRKAGNRANNRNNTRSEQMMRMTPQERVALMTKELNLSAKEAADVLALCEKQEAERKKQVEENRAQRNLTREANVARRDEMRAERLKEVEKQTAELEKIIGKERVQQWTDLRQDVRDTNRAGRVDGRGYNRNSQNIDNRRSDQMMRMTPKERVDLMTKELDLTSQQAAQVLALTEKQEAERVAQVAENRKLRGTGTQNSDARRKEMREMREKQVKDHYAELEKIIGKEKLEKWNDLRQDVRDDNRAGRRNPSNKNR